MTGAPSSFLEIEFGGSPLRLLPARAAWCPETSTVWVADLHLGKEESFRKSGIPVPSVLSEDLSRLSTVLSETSARRLVILGDLIHARTSHSLQMTREFAGWRQMYAAIEILLVRGNHDRHAGDPPVEWQIECVDEPYLTTPYLQTHYPRFDSQTANLAGHLHPKFRLRSRAETLNLPCFLLRKETLVLPAFGQFIDHGSITPERGDGVFVVAGTEVIPMMPGAAIIHRGR